MSIESLHAAPFFFFFFFFGAGRARSHHGAWREMPVISRQIILRHDRTSFDKKIKKKMVEANTRLSKFLHLNLESLVRQAHE